jgi:hypothetical protein
MRLHLAIKDVLVAAGRPLSPREIADEVNRSGLYIRGDAKPLPSGQVSARVYNHPDLFVKTPAGIWLTDHATTALPTADIGWSRNDAQAKTLPAPVFVPGTASVADVERSLLDPKRFQSAAVIDEQVPDQFGLYAIRVRDVAVLPETYRALAERRGSTLIYLGEATGQTLRNRFLHKELRGRGHGTFFRSIGAVVGFRPPIGSLIGKGNQRNYRFSPTDNAAIVKWINGNLEVSWAAFDDSVHTAEVALIRKHTPLLNLRDNPRALPELSALRALCCQIATTAASSSVL